MVVKGGCVSPLAGKLPQPMYRATVVNDDGTTTPISDVRSAVQWAKEAMEEEEVRPDGGDVHSVEVNPKRSDICSRDVQLTERDGEKFYVLASRRTRRIG